MPALCEQLFGVPWDALALEHIDAFFGDVGEEGLTWEAKGGEFSPHLVRKAACAFANSERGGVLVLGVDGNARTGWSVVGMDLGDEPEHRLSQIIRRGVSPTPDHEHMKSWTRGDGHVLLVQIGPVSVPPAITSQGQVYERVVGASEPVKEPLRLAGLYATGESARKAAEGHAVTAAGQLVETNPRSHLEVNIEDEVRFAIAAAATAYPPDISSRLFTSTFRERLYDAGEQLGDLPPNYPLRARLEDYTEQDRVFVAGEAPNPAAGHPSKLAVGGFWFGAAVVGWAWPDQDASLRSVLAEKIVPAWKEVVGLVQELGGSEPAHLVLVVPGTPKLLGGPPEVGSRAVVRRDVDLREPTETEVASVGRELLRAGGNRADEPA